MLSRTIDDVRKQIKEWKKQGLSVGLVPTMGALHKGHLSLIEKSVQECDKTVVSVFVNPIQFGPSEDFDKYPRVLDSDMELCKNAGVDMVFSPSAQEMYGDCQIRSNDFLTYVVPPFFYVNKLCGKSRMGHFDGVCTVVSKLFNIVQPDFAFFGQKDAQQLIIIKKMVKDLSIPVEIIGGSIVRDENGLALSSRNQYLDDEGLKNALTLSMILNNIKACYQKGITDVNALSETALNMLTDKHELEYLEFVDKNDLEDKKIADDETLVLIAVKVGSVRLIDNIILGKDVL